MACTFSSLVWPHGSAPAALASLLFGKTVNRDFPTSSRTCIFFLHFLLFLFSDLLTSFLLLSDSSHLCFSISPYCWKFDFQTSFDELDFMIQYRISKGSLGRNFGGMDTLNYLNHLLKSLHHLSQWPLSVTSVSTAPRPSHHLNRCITSDITSVESLHQLNHYITSIIAPRKSLHELKHSTT